MSSTDDRPYGIHIALTRVIEKNTAFAAQYVFVLDPAGNLVPFPLRQELKITTDLGDFDSEGASRHSAAV
jgi:hypothetical protein